jgi:hypothetical protein
VTLKAKYAAAKAHGMRALGMWTPDATRWDKHLSASMWRALPAPNKTNTAGADRCTELLRASRPREDEGGGGVGGGSCALCMAHHFSALAAAGCTTAEVDCYCSGRG